jgi:hypothetical protein
MTANRVSLEQFLDPNVICVFECKDRFIGILVNRGPPTSSMSTTSDSDRDAV